MIKPASDEPTRRCTVLPEPHFAELRPLLVERLQQLAARISPQNFGSLFDPLLREVFQQGLTEAGAHEGTIWLVDQEEQGLIPAYNTGPKAGQFVGSFRQPLDQGLISMVFASEQPFLENEVHKNAHQSRALDLLLQNQTEALIALPFNFLKSCRGVVSCVQLSASGKPAFQLYGFTQANLASIHRTVGVISRLLEYSLLAKTVGWQTDR